MKDQESRALCPQGLGFRAWGLTPVTASFTSRFMSYLFSKVINFSSDNSSTANRNSPIFVECSMTWARAHSMPLGHELSMGGWRLSQAITSPLVLSCLRTSHVAHSQRGSPGRRPTAARLPPGTLHPTLPASPWFSKNRARVKTRSI